MNFTEVLSESKYDELSEHPYLGENVILMVVGGSISYGTNNENSDIDLRGICYNPKDQLLGITNFEQFESDKTDTVIFGLKKATQLWLSCNPNAIELLGCQNEHYLVLKNHGRLLLDNAGLFLSKKAINSFGGYAHQQLRRLENALARDRLSDVLKEKHIVGSIKNQIHSFNERYQNLGKDELLKVGLTQDKLSISVWLNEYPLREFISMLSEMNDCVRNYEKLNHRNRKKDDTHLNKHAMHLVRLYYTAMDILEHRTIVTYRSEENQQLLSIRNGYYMEEDGAYKEEFFALVDSLQTRFEYACLHTNLPDEPDYNKVQELLVEINRAYLF